MDALCCKTKETIEKEIAVYLLAYNLVQWTMAAAAMLSGVLPRALSFTGANRLLAVLSINCDTRQASGDTSDGRCAGQHRLAQTAAST